MELLATIGDVFTYSILLCVTLFVYKQWHKYKLAKKQTFKII